MAVEVSSSITLKDALDYYETGKHRRYSLLFSVNGGAFAIAKLLTGESGKSGIILGGLTLQELSVGMALFTAFMVWDIYVFGTNVRTTYLKAAFDRPGKTVLLLLGALLLTGWLLVGLRGAVA
jgi:hypothetical protein